jgi:hypothetical protein
MRGRSSASFYKPSTLQKFIKSISAEKYRTWSIVADKVTQLVNWPISDDSLMSAHEIIRYELVVYHWLKGKAHSPHHALA